MLLNQRMRTIPNMFVASLAVSDLLLGLCSSVPFGFPALVTSHWLFNDTACQFQGYVSIYLDLSITLGKPVPEIRASATSNA